MALRNTFPQRIGNTFGSGGLGGAMGRAVPYLGLFGIGVGAASLIKEKEKKKNAQYCKPIA